MKRIFGMVLFCALLLCGCGNSSTENETTSQTADNANVFSYTINGVAIVPGEDFSEALSKLGEPVDFNEAASCYFDGMDKQYFYDGFEIKTYPVGDKDYVQDICVSVDTYSTPEGITIGSSLDEVVAAYGEDYEKMGKMYNYYVTEDKYMYFFVTNDGVKYFGYAINASN